MGIPAYFSHIIRDYKPIIQNLNTHANYQHLFLDSNSIIYDSLRKMEISISDPNFETNLAHAVCEQIMVYITKINPSKSVFIAFDGVAPVAKLHQQKTRRYKSEFERQFRLRNDPEYNPAKIWNTANITPGTPFMNLLGNYIHTYFTNIQKTNTQLKSLDIIISDASEPGEGEHKIYERIRQLSPSLLKTNANIVVYGLDSDLIMLSLLHLKSCPNLYLFRETPHFIKTIDKSLDPEELYILDIPKFEDLLKKKLMTEYSVNGIDDYVFISFILGNDFIPHSPMLNIRTNGINHILETYKHLFGGRQVSLVTANKKINWKLFRAYVEELAKNELPWFKKEYEIRAKQERKAKMYSKTPMEKFDALPLFSRGGEGFVDPHSAGWRWRYYKLLFDIDVFSSGGEEAVRRVCINYLEALEWTLSYYYGSCPDQRWCYGHYYTPLMSDLVKYIPYFDSSFFSAKECVDVAIHPYSQLLYVLPPATHDLLPQNILMLFRDDVLPLKEKFGFSWHFCKHFWECHLLAPHLDINAIEKRVLENV